MKVPPLKKWAPRAQSQFLSKPAVLAMLILMIAALMAVLPACGRRTETPAGSPVSQNPEPGAGEPPADMPEEPQAELSPLTGLPMVSPGSPVTVAIDNNPSARPQTGLNEADIVYEIPAEGGITRFLALFHSRSPEVVGPVRSSRPYLALLAREWGAVFGHCGGDPELDRYINEWKVVDANEFRLGHLFWRDKTRSMPHNLYTSVENLRKVPSEELPPRLRGMSSRSGQRSPRQASQYASARATPWSTGLQKVGTTATSWKVPGENPYCTWTGTPVNRF